MYVRIAGHHAGEDVSSPAPDLVLDSLFRAAHRMDHGARRPVPLINAA